MKKKAFLFLLPIIVGILGVLLLIFVCGSVIEEGENTLKILLLGEEENQIKDSAIKCEYVLDENIFPKDVESKRKETEKKLDDKSYTNAVLAIYEVKNKKIKVETIAEEINKIVKYADEKSLKDKNIIIQTYEYGIKYIDFMDKNKESTQTLGYSKKYYDSLSKGMQSIMDYQFYLKVLMKIDKICRNSISVDNLPLEKPFVITQNFGVETVSSIGPSKHLGIDLVNKYGAKIYAVADGEIWSSYTACDPNGGYLGNMCGGALYGGGNQVVLKFEKEGQVYYGAYFHMETVLVNTKEKVKAGQLIGTQGHSGNSTGSHLHFELRKDPPQWGKYSSDLVNPNDVFDFSDGEKKKK